VNSSLSVSPTRRLFIALGAVPICIIVAAAFVVDLYIVPTDSMRPTLVPGDIVLCVRGLERGRGDVVVFRTPGEGFGVKRIVGVPADTLSYVRKVLTVNGQTSAKVFVAKLPIEDPMDQVFEQNLATRTFRILEAYGESLKDVGEQALSSYFLLGDNRDGSVDSREFGEVLGSEFRCRVVAILATERTKGYSFDRAGLVH